MSPNGRSRNGAEARTFLSEILVRTMWSGMKACEILRAVDRSGVAADKNVRAPVLSEKSSQHTSNSGNCSAESSSGIVELVTANSRLIR